MGLPTYQLLSLEILIQLLNFIRNEISRDLISGKSDDFSSKFKISLKHRITYFLFEVYFVSVVEAKLKY
jgi:hypothetical protein